MLIVHESLKIIIIFFTVIKKMIICEIKILWEVLTQEIVKVLTQGVKNLYSKTN